MTWGARKTSGPVTYGVEGVFTYNIPGIQKTLAVMFSVPYLNYNFNNRVDIMLYDGKVQADNQLWEKMYKNNPNKFKGDGELHEKNLEPALGEKGIRAEFSMATSSQPIIQIKILPRKSNSKWW